MEQLANIELQLQVLWEKVKQAGELIARLREEKQSLKNQNENLLQEIAKLRAEVKTKDLKLASVENEAQEKIFSNGEREDLAERVKQLLTRIDGYL